ncbi:Myb-related transcription factor, partner of profilin [Anabarilius grahami]|uniref:Myb-related transcription factor, partner of profilin n=1 Tax=Anabarilius grahami TaxID=495550 RepID=A0A3N0XL06_ANAGA|nr:Myb-related transcription factor, partner of profilin [Anabarilius grahami]
MSDDSGFDIAELFVFGWCRHIRNEMFADTITMKTSARWSGRRNRQRRIRNYNVTTQFLSMSVIAGWSIYEGLLTNIQQTQKMEKKRNRKPNWTEEQGLLLAQLVNEHKGMLRGKFGPTVTSQGKRRAWDTISQTINASFPLVVWTGDDCEKRWYVLQSKAKDEIAAHKRESSLTGGGPPAKRLSQVADTVFQVLGHSEVSVTGLPTGIDTSMMQALEMQQR